MNEKYIFTKYESFAEYENKFVKTVQKYRQHFIFNMISIYYF